MMSFWQVPFGLVLSFRLLRSRHTFISFLGVLVFASLGLGVAVLIIVASVMNGMAEEIEDNLLRNLPHAEVVAQTKHSPDWKELYERLNKADTSFIRAYPYESGYALAGTEDGQTVVKVRAVGKTIGSYVKEDYWDTLYPKSWHILIDEQLATQLNVRVGEPLRLTLDKGVASPLGTMTRHRYFILSGIVSGLRIDALPSVWIDIQDGQQLMGRNKERERGLALWLSERDTANEVLSDVRAVWQECCTASSWQSKQRELFAAIRMEKRVVMLLLFFVLLVAVFNLVSMFNLLIKHKTHSVVMLMTLGASRTQIYRSFFLVGIFLGAAGVLCGTALGLVTSLFINDLFVLWQNITGLYVFRVTDLYISQLPSRIEWSDVILISSLGMVFCIPATLLPLTGVLGLRPAEVLRHV